ncbi:MAG: hypothetical protein ACK51M_09570, partial [Burkholderiales bacterium]
FMALSDWLWARTGATHRLSHEAVADALLAWRIEVDGASHDEAVATLADDYAASGARGRPAFMARGLAGGRRAAPSRQARHADTAEGTALSAAASPTAP